MVVGVVGMDTKFLLAAICLGVLAPGTATAATATTPATTPATTFQLYLPDVSVILGIGSGGIGVDIRTSQTHRAAKVDMRLDATDIASIATVATETQGCVSAAKVMTCHRVMDIEPNGESVALISVAGIGPAGTGHITVTASVNGVAASPYTSTVTVTRPDRRIPLGAKVKAPGQTKVKIQVGIKNIGPGVASWPLPEPQPVPTDVYIKFHGDTVAESASKRCFPWGPWDGGWGWLHPGESSYWYTCTSDPLEPGQSLWYELVMLVNPARPVVTGTITVRDGITGRDLEAPIVIDTRTAPTLPVTGPHVHNIALAAVALIVPGALLLTLTRRIRRTRPKT